MSDKQDETLVSDRMKEMLRKCLEEKKITVSDIDIQAGSSHGDNYLGVIAKANVTGTDQNGEPISSSYIIKSAPKLEGIRTNMPIRFVYEREIYIYNTVLPAMKKFQEEKSIKNPFASHATCLKTSNEDRDEALIMEDMTLLGYRMQNRKKALDYNHIKLVLTDLARFHAVSFAMLDQRPEVFAEISKAAETNFFTQMDLSLFKSTMESLCNKAQDSLNPETDREAIEKFKKYSATCVEDMEAMMTVNYYPYCVVRHADSWTNNFLFAYKDEKNPDVPTDLCILDWQISHVSAPVLDLLYFFAATTDKQLRDQHYDELLKHYHSTMTEFGAELGSDIQKLYPFEVFMEQLQKCGSFGMTSALMLLPLLTSDSDEIPDMNQLFEEEDVCKSLEAMSFTSKNNEEYETRIRDLCLHMVERNYF